jgi:hypothetical protein
MLTPFSDYDADDYGDGLLLTCNRSGGQDDRLSEMWKSPLSWGVVLQLTSFPTFLPADHDMLDDYGTALTHGILPRIPF